ncbi:MAG: hypothetical protein U9Q73_01125 [Nanoarchaeota archaeon]|nr:hypothetical protein [Nanoarchaeota archaeon]
MTLDQILGQLTVERDGKIKVNDKYFPETILLASDNLEKLKATNLETTEGLEAYKTITGENPYNDSFQRINFKKNVLLEGGREDLRNYMGHHFGNLIGELNEQIRTSLSYTHCPIEDISDKSATRYNVTRKIVGDTKEKIRKINENPEVYLAEEIKNESQIMKKYLSRHAEEFIKFEQSEAQQNAILAIHKYGQTNFLKDTKRYLESPVKELLEKQSKLETSKKTKIEATEDKNGRVLTSKERANLVSDDCNKLEELSKEHMNIELGNRLTQEVASYAIGAIKEESNKKENQNNRN